MEWEALGAIAETLGAVGVIVTLTYLAVQVKQNRLGPVHPANGDRLGDAANHHRLD